jgi:signal transduction histidine kinase/CheY-like chemotaxis protein
MEVTPHRTPTARNRRAAGPLKLVTLAVLGVVAATSLSVSTGVRSLVKDQEKRLLHERTSEAGILVTTLFATPTMTLPLLAATTRPSEDSTANFTFVAQAARGGVGTIGALRVRDGVVTTLSAVGDAPAHGTPVTGKRAELALRAALTKKTATGVFDGPAGRTMVLNVPSGEALVLFQEIPLAGLSQSASMPQSPFSELEGAIYAGPTEDPATLLFATADHLPISGRNVDRHPVAFGGDTWLFVTRSKSPLVGSFAASAHWFVLVAGLLAALLTAVLVETLARRRVYALALVDQSTAALREALKEQARLEQGQRQARELAETANRSKSEFLSRMSHELRTPLNAVLGFGQLLELDDLTEPQQESVEQIVKGGRHLLHLINEVLDISRIETGSLSLSPEPVRATEVVCDSLTLMRPLADHRAIVIDQRIAGFEHIHVLADRQRLKQILLNLVANAVKYNHHGGSVTVSCEVDSDALVITVADTGPGIPADLIDRLFVPFERLGAERTDVEGSGVGLALSQRLAEAMSGVITVASVFGQGSRFSVRLPLAESPLERYDRVVGAGVVPQDQAGEPVEARHKVLYIEDNVSNVRLVERILEHRRDIVLIPAMQASLGLALAREHRPSLILLDVHLPDSSGDEVLKELRSDPLTATTPVVVVSADATSRQIARLMAGGANAYLTKPLDVKEFLAVLSDTIGSVDAVDSEPAVTT